MKKATLPIITIVAAAFLAGCGQDNTPVNTQTQSHQSALPAGLVVASLPGTPVSPIEARSTAKAGEKILLSGNIAGRKDPFVEGRAMFTLVGMELAMCDEKGETDCPAPWDLCCTPPEKTMKHAATVQVVDASGNPVKESLDGYEGIKPGAKIAVSGNVEQVDEHTFVVNADSIAFVKQAKPQQHQHGASCQH